MKTITVAFLSAAAALAAPTLASASTYCVGTSQSACEISKPGTAAGLTQALAEAQSSAAGDVVRVGPGTFTGNFVYSSVSEVDIQGSGRATVLQGVGSDPALSVTASGPASMVSDLEVRMADIPHPGIAAGLRIGAAVADSVRAENPGDSYGAAVQLQSGGDVRQSTVLAGPATGIEGYTGAGQHDVRDSFIAGAHGVGTNAGSTWTLENLEILARYTGVSSGGSTTLRDSLVRISGDPTNSTATQALYQFSAGVLNANHVTIQVADDVTYGALVVMSGSGTANLHMKNSILHGSFAASSFSRAGIGGGTANISVGHSNFSPPGLAYVGAGAGAGVFQQTPNGTNTDVDPHFVDPTVTLASPTLNLHLRHDSPLIDKGEPGGSQEEDLAGAPRLVDGDGNGNAVRDMGAYEYQRAAPTAKIAEPAASAFALGAPVAFSAQGSADPDPGDSLDYAWSFGDGTAGTGREASHAYDAAGPRTVTLTVTDPSGLAATATKALLVDAPAPTPPEAGSGDELRPAISSLSLSAPVFRVKARAAAAKLVPRGTRVRFTLSEPASVRFAITRGSRTGRWLRAGTFVRPGVAGPNAVRFTGRLRMRGQARALRTGRYRIALVATDAAGNASAPERRRFRVIR
jgi:hypothetical protein